MDLMACSSSPVQQGPSENSRGLSRQKRTTKAEMIDSYRNAPPHQVSTTRVKDATPCWWVCAVYRKLKHGSILELKGSELIFMLVLSCAFCLQALAFLNHQLHACNPLSISLTEFIRYPPMNEKTTNLIA